MSDSTKKNIRVHPSSSVVKKNSNDLLSVSSALLSEVNQALDARFMDLPEDVRALLVQKGALTQTIIRELTRLIELAADKTEKYEALLDHCAEWQEEFFIPLKAQSDGEEVDEAVYVKDLEEMIDELSRVLEERNHR